MPSSAVWQHITVELVLNDHVFARKFWSLSSQGGLQSGGSSLICEECKPLYQKIVFFQNRLSLAAVASQDISLYTILCITVEPALKTTLYIKLPAYKGPISLIPRGILSMLLNLNIKTTCV